MYKIEKSLVIAIFKIFNFISIILIMIFLIGKTHAYEMSIDDKVIGYVKNKKIINEYYEEKLHKTNGESGRVVENDLISFRSRLVDKDICLSDDDAIKIIDNEADIYVNAYNLILDGNKIANIDNEEVFSVVKKRLIDYYIDFHDLNDVRINWARIKEKVELKKEVIDLKSIVSENDLYNFIIENNNNDNLIATVEIVATKTYLENSSGNKVQLMSVSSRSNQKEQYNINLFEKEIVREITYNNEKYIGRRNVKIKNLKPKINEVNSNQLLFLNNPSKSSIITSKFGLRWGGEKHHGIDIAGNIGDPIFASESGFASIVTYNNIYGNYIKLDHGKGIETLYGHCDTMLVKEGDYVSKGQIIGRIGNTGRSTGPHLHFEVRVNGRADNPLNYVAY